MADLTVTPYCTSEGVGAVDLSYIGLEQPSSFFFQILNAGVMVKEATSSGVTVTINDVPNTPSGQQYTAKVFNGDTDAEIGNSGFFTVDCTPAPVLGCTDPMASNYDPAATEDNGTCVYPQTPGTATPPAAKYMAVGGTLSNPIEYTFAFQLLDSLGAAKTGHYVKVNIYRQGELTPFATTRQRIRNGAAVVDVARFVKALVSSQAAFDDSLTVTTDTNAIAGFTIGFIESWGTTTMAEVKENTVKYAVNAALQTLDGNYVQHVITATAS